MRNYQINPYKHYNITWRFFLSRPDEAYEDLIQSENKTHGDIVILRDIEDTRDNARQRKPFGFFRYVEEQLGKFKYVAKMDDDAFLNIPMFMEMYMTEEHLNQDKNIIARMIKQEVDHNCMEPIGWFYAVSWNLFLVLNDRLAHHHIDRQEEDFEVGLAICQSGVQYNYTLFDVAKAHDLQFVDKPVRNDYWHVAWNQSLLVHQLKSEFNYVQTTQCCSMEGFNQTCIDKVYERGYDLPNEYYWKSKD